MLIGLIVGVAIGIVIGCYAKEDIMEVLSKRNRR